MIETVIRNSYFAFCRKNNESLAVKRIISHRILILQPEIEAKIRILGKNDKNCVLRNLETAKTVFWEVKTHFNGFDKIEKRILGKKYIEFKK